MELIKVCLICLLMVISVSAGAGGSTGCQPDELMLKRLMKEIKTEVSNQVKIEINGVKEEILREIRADGEKHEKISKELERTREGKSVL